MEDREKLIGLHGLFLMLLLKVYKFLPTSDQELMSAAGYALQARLTPIFGMLQSNFKWVQGVHVSQIPSS